MPDTVTIVEEVIGTVEIVSAGPRGPQGPQGEQGPPGDVAGEGLPAGGMTGQILAKVSDTDFDVDWTSHIEDEGLIIDGGLLG